MIEACKRGLNLLLASPCRIPLQRSRYERRWKTGEMSHSDVIKRQDSDMGMTLNCGYVEFGARQIKTFQAAVNFSSRRIRFFEIKIRSDKLKRRFSDERRSEKFEEFHLEHKSRVAIAQPEFSLPTKRSSHQLARKYMGERQKSSQSFLFRYNWRRLFLAFSREYRDGKSSPTHTKQRLMSHLDCFFLLGESGGKSQSLRRPAKHFRARWAIKKADQKSV